MKTDSVWKEIEPYFLANGSWGCTVEKFQDAFSKTESLCRELDVPLHRFLQAVFFPRFSETITKFRVRPKHLHSDWAIRKLRDHVSLGTLATSGTMEALFIQDTKKYITSLGISETEYFTGGTIFPMCLEDIRHRRISICYCCSRKEFRDMYKLLPQDAKDEYFEDIDVIDIATQIKINKPISDAINSVDSE